MSDLLKPKKNSWPHIAISIAVVEIHWLLSCWFMMTHDAAKMSTLASVVWAVLELAGIYFAMLFGFWYCKKEIPMKVNDDCHTSRT